jgi:hypothetical protein
MMSEAFRGVEEDHAGVKKAGCIVTQKNGRGMTEGAGMG